MLLKNPSVEVDLRFWEALNFQAGQQATRLELYSPGRNLKLIGITSQFLRMVPAFS